jgi:hypothetical protein
VTGYVVALCAGGATVLPLAGETEVVCALAADVVVAKMVVEGLRVREILGTLDPQTLVSSRVCGRGQLGVVARGKGGIFRGGGTGGRHD